MTDALALRQAWPLYAGMTVAASAAVVASASTLASLAQVAGWSGWTPWLLPAALDVGGSVGGWIWLRPGATPPARRFGRSVAMTGAVGTLVGNAAGHLIESGYLHVGPSLVVVVGAVPAAVLVALAHLAALMVTVNDGPSAVPSTTPSPAPSATPLGAVRTATEASTPVVADVTPSKRSSQPGPVAVTASLASNVQRIDARDTRAAVLSLVEAGPVTVADLVRSTGRSRTTIVGHLETLADDGVIARDQRKRYVVQRPAAVELLRHTVAGG